MNDNEVKTLLNALERASASSRFTSEVLARVRERARRPLPSWRLITATATCLLIVSGTCAVNVQRQKQRGAEYRRIESELHEMRSQVDALDQQQFF